MTTSQSRNLRKAGAVALSLALAMSTLAITPASAAKKVKLAKTKITVNVGKTKTVKIKNVKKKQVKKLTVKSSKKAVAKAKASKKTAIKVTGKKAGSAKVTANLKLKKKVGGKKAYKLTLKVTVKKAAPAPTVAPTVAPTAAPTPVVSGEAVTLDKSSYSCKVGGPAVTMTANIVPNTSNELPTWTIADPTKATVSGAAAAVNGVATAQLIGLAEGSTSVTVTLANGKSQTALVTVGKKDIVAKIVGGKQTKSNQLRIDFDIDYKTDNHGFDRSKFDVDVLNDKGVVTETIEVTKVESTVAVSGASSALLNLDHSFKNNDKVKVNLYKTDKEFASSWDFVASVGAPVMMNIETKEAEINSQTKIKVALTDANGVDVTAVEDIDTRVTFEIALTDGTYNASPASLAWVNINKKDSKATVKAKYTFADAAKTPLEATGEILGVEPKPTVGDPHVMAYSATAAKTWGSGDDSVAKFYTVDPAKEKLQFEVAEGGDAVYSFYASTQDDDKDAISYEDYTVSSSKGDIAACAVEAKGKYAQIAVSGVKAGSATINVKCLKNTKTADYTIPITVKAKPKFTTFTVTPKRATVSNTFDDDYQKGNGFDITAKDDMGQTVTPELAFEITSPTSEKFKGSETITGSDKTTFTLTGNRFDQILKNPAAATCYFDAKGIAHGTYTVTVTAEYDGVKKTVPVNISVKSVPTACFTKAGAEMKYQIEASKSALNYTTDTQATYKIAAYNSGVFVGYVKSGTPGDITNKDGRVFCQIGDAVNGTFSSGGFATNGSVFGALDGNADANYNVAFTTGTVFYPNKLTALNGVYFEQQAGTKWGSGSALYNSAANFKGSKFVTSEGLEQAFATSTAVAANADTYYTDELFDNEFAKARSYTVRFGLQSLDKDGKTVVANKDLSVSVKNSFFIPTVTEEARTLKDFSDTGIMEAMKCNTDLNSNESNNASIKAVYGKADKTKFETFDTLDTSKSSAVVEYVQVDEYTGGAGPMTFIIKYGKSFNAVS